MALVAGGTKCRRTTTLWLLVVLGCSDAAPAPDAGTADSPEPPPQDRGDASQGSLGGSSAGAGGSSARPEPIVDAGEPAESCQNSLDCPLGQVCDVTQGACVECVTSEDCDDDAVCDGSKCYAVCSSDTDCTPMGLLCNRESGHCAECGRHADCPPERHCDGARCAPDLCPEGGSVCVIQGVATCTPEGDRFVASMPCAERTTCVEDGISAACEPWVCSAGATECSDRTHLIQCSVDGLEVVDTVDCADEGSTCAGSSCRSAECVASERFCDGDQVRECASDGLSSTFVTTCQAGEHCHEGACDPGVCEPDQPVCNGTIATTCSADGSAFEDDGDECAVGGEPEACLDGACVPRLCSPGALSCEDGAERSCSRTGASYVTERVCAQGEVCLASGRCGPPLCTPGAVFCSVAALHEVRRCNADGSDSASEKVCTADQICSPEELDCVRPAPGSCVVEACPPCTLIGVLACCTPSNVCGCTWAPGGYCF